MNLPTDDNVSSVTVKMEGISRTRLEHPRFDMPGERPREKRKAAELEIHRVPLSPAPGDYSADFRRFCILFRPYSPPRESEKTSPRPQDSP